MRISKEFNENEVIRVYIDSDKNDIKSIAKLFDIPIAVVSTVIDKYLQRNNKIDIVPSLDLANTYYVFNCISERKFTVGISGFINERFLFNSDEKKELIYLGFKL